MWLPVPQGLLLCSVEIREVIIVIPQSLLIQAESGKTSGCISSSKNPIRAIFKIKNISSIITEVMDAVWPSWIRVPRLKRIMVPTPTCESEVPQTSETFLSFILGNKGKQRKRTRNKTMGRDTEFAETSGQWTVHGTYEQGKNKHTNWESTSLERGTEEAFVICKSEVKGNFSKRCSWLKEWKDDLTENVVEILEITNLEEISVKTLKMQDEFKWSKHATRSRSEIILSRQTLAKLH